MDTNEPHVPASTNKEGAPASKFIASAELAKAGVALKECIQRLYNAASALQNSPPAMEFIKPLIPYLQNALSPVRFVYDKAKRAEEDAARTTPGPKTPPSTGQ